MRKIYGIILGFILLAFALCGSIQIYQNSEKTSSDRFQLVAFIISDVFIGGLIIALFAWVG